MHCDISKRTTDFQSQTLFSSWSKSSFLNNWNTISIQIYFFTKDHKLENIKTSQLFCMKSQNTGVLVIICHSNILFSVCNTPSWGHRHVSVTEDDTFGLFFGLVWKVQETGSWIQKNSLFQWESHPKSLKRQEKILLWNSIISEK